jgi:N-methylhydantoinase A
VEAIAVCLLHAYANDAHERRIAELAAAHAPGIPVSLSCDVLPEIREYERTSTTVINAYLQPVVGSYIARMQRMLRARGVTAPLLLMQSAGGLMRAGQAARFPVHIVESGPAAGVVGAIALARRCGTDDLIAFDMGGTTAKAALVAGGEAARAAEFQVGGGIMSGSRLLTGGGYTLRIPAIDLAEVGAGGGSIVWLDRAGAPQVGPHSAGAVPGPACYGRGGSAPTVTDCALLLGWLGESGLAGGTVPLDPRAALAALSDAIATPLRLAPEVAAYGAVEVATASMIRAIRAVSSERGRDPRDFALVAFGGNGGIFGPLVARSLGMRRVIIPPAPGLFSATGLLEGRVEHQASRTHKVLLGDADPHAITARFDELARATRRVLAESIGDDGACELRRVARLRYHGQSFELTVAVQAGDIGQTSLLALAEAFATEHERTYGHRAADDEPVELVSLVVQGLAASAPTASPVPEIAAAPTQAATRRAYFGSHTGWYDVPVLTRAGLPTAATAGPLIIEEYDATIVVPPDAAARRDDFGNVLIDV